MDPNDVVVFVGSRAAFSRLVEDAWTDSATGAGRRALALVDRRDAAIAAAVAAPANARDDDVAALAGTWTHIFDEGDRELERECEILVSADARQVVAMTIVRDGKHRDATLAEMQDVSRSLGDNEVAGNPEGWDLVRVDPIPAWAADQIVDRSEGMVVEGR